MTQSYMYDKSPYIHRKIQNATWQHNNATKNFDYTTIAARLKTISESNTSHSLVCLNQLTGIQPSHLPQQSCLSKGHTLKNCK